MLPTIFFLHNFSTNRHIQLKAPTPYCAISNPPTQRDLDGQEIIKQFHKLVEHHQDPSSIEWDQYVQIVRSINERHRIADELEFLTTMKENQDGSMSSGMDGDDASRMSVGSVVLPPIHHRLTKLGLVKRNPLPAGNSLPAQKTLTKQKSKVKPTQRVGGV